MKTRDWLFLGFALGLLLVVIGVALLTAQPYTYQGSLIDPAAPAPDFTLTAPDASAYHLASQRGKVVLIFFGYTHCPDVCPVTLSEFKAIRQQLGPRADEVQFLFITVDPERDTPQLLGEHVALFDPAIIALSGELPTLQAVWQAYGVTRQIKETGGATDYLVEHTARTYLVDKSGNLRLTYPFGFGVPGIAQDLEHLLDEK